MRLRTSALVDRFGRRMDRPVPPSDIADAVEVWARAWGRSARLEWHDLLGCWCIHLSRRHDDPVMALVQAGLLPEATESVTLNEPAGPGLGYRALDIEQMGAAGVVALLDRGNTWSGRGEFASLQEAIHAQVQAALDQPEKRMEERVAESRDYYSDHRRRLLGIPLVRGADLH